MAASGNRPTPPRQDLVKCPDCGTENEASRTRCISCNVRLSARRLTEAQLAANRRSRAARIAVNASWARTTDRTERTAKGTRNSPVSYDYWLRKITEEGTVRPKDRAAAAENAHRAYMTTLSAKAAEGRRRKRAKQNA